MRFPHVTILYIKTIFISRHWLSSMLTPHSDGLTRHLVKERKNLISKGTKVALLLLEVFLLFTFRQKHRLSSTKEEESE
jgi:hypothetical protein